MQRSSGRISTQEVGALLEQLGEQQAWLRARRRGLGEPPPEPATPGPAPRRRQPQDRPAPSLPALLGQLGYLYERAGWPPLEGGLVGVLLAAEGPVTLAGAATSLGVTEGSLARVVRSMVRRGDLERVGTGPVRHRSLRLTASARTARLDEWRALCLAVAGLCEETAATLDSDPARERLLDHAGAHRWAAAGLGRALALGSAEER